MGSVSRHTAARSMMSGHDERGGVARKRGVSVGVHLLNDIGCRGLHQRRKERHVERRVASPPLYPGIFFFLSVTHVTTRRRDHGEFGIVRVHKVRQARASATQRRQKRIAPSCLAGLHLSLPPPSAKGPGGGGSPGPSPRSSLSKTLACATRLFRVALTNVGVGWRSLVWLRLQWGQAKPAWRGKCFRPAERNPPQRHLTVSRS